MYAVISAKRFNNKKEGMLKMRGTKILALLCGIVMLGDQIPVTVAPAYAVESYKAEKTKITLDENFIDDIIVKEKVYDKTKDAEVDLSNVKLNGVSKDDKVSLTGKAEFDDEKAGEDKVVRITDIKLTGDDSSKYELSLDNNSIETKGTVKPKTIRIKPTGAFAEGEIFPKNLTYVHEEKDIIEGDKVNITAKVSVECSGDDSKVYEYKIDNDKATGNSNYILEIDDECEPVPADPDAPEIKETTLKKGDGTNFFKQMDYGIVADGKVELTVYAESKYNFPMTFTISDSANKEVKRMEKTPSYDAENDKYIAEAVFTIDAEKNKAYDLTFDIVVVSNGAKSNKLPLAFKLSDEKQETSRIIIERSGPEIKQFTAKNHGDPNKYFDASAKLCDNETGIAEIWYRWDSDFKQNERWINYRDIYKSEHNEDFSHDPGAVIDFYSKVNWEQSTDVSVVRDDGSHLFDIKIVNNAGVETIREHISTNGIDTKPPIVESILFKKNTESAWDKMVKVLSFGNFVKGKIEIKITAKDEGGGEDPEISGISSVELTDGSDKKCKVISVLEASDAAPDTYTCNVSPQLKAEALYLKLVDKNENEAYYSVSDLLKNKNINLIEGKDVDWSKLQSNTWVFDTIPPKVEYSYENGVEENDVIYFTPERGKPCVSVTDENGLYDVTITKLHRLIGEEVGDSSSVKKTENIESDNKLKRGEHKYEETIDISKINTGLYSLGVLANDCAGNTLKNTDDQLIYIDKDDPICDFSVKSEKYIQNDNECWVSCGDNSKNEPIILKVDGIKKGADIKKIFVNVKGQEEIRFTPEITKSETGAYAYVSFTTDDVMYSEDHTYEITAIAAAVSGRESKPRELTVHVDTMNPTVNRFIVEKKNEAINSVLNILSFGVFSNGSIRLSVDASDGKHDIGLEKVMISYDDVNGKHITDKMEKDKNRKDVYFYDLDIDTKIFQSNIMVTAYDKLGKQSCNIPNIANTFNSDDPDERAYFQETDGNTFVMLETVPPSLTVKMPEADSLNRSDGQLWYRKHTNSENDAEKYIEVKVKDADSGIQQVNMRINDISIDHFDHFVHYLNIEDMKYPVSEIERNNKKLPDMGAIGGEQQIRRSDLCGEFIFEYSTDKIAEMIEPNKDGSYVIEFEVVDNAGNVTKVPLDAKGNEYAESKVIFYRDDISPKVERFVFDRASADNISDAGSENFIERLEYGYYFKEAFDLTIISSDPEPSSQLDTADFRFVPYENGEMKEAVIHAGVPVADGKATITVPAGFKGQIYGKVYDKVRNVSEECTPQAYVVDEKEPVIYIEPLPDNSTGKDNNGNKIYTDKVEFRVTISDPQSGLRSVQYSKSSELDSFDDVITSITNDRGFSENALIENGWEITGRDENLITEVSQVFVFDKDDNDIFMTFKAVDRSGNETKPEECEKFTIDTIAPKITITNSSNPINERYYNSNVRFSISITERNFSSERISANIRNSYTDTVPVVSFRDGDSANVHYAEITFPEGDYSFSLSGEDLGGNKAVITYNGEDVSDYFYNSFNVDLTKPKVQTNFKSFGKDGNESIYYNYDKTAEITVTEHNFYDGDLGISVQSKSAGSSHSNSGGDWVDIGYRADWTSDGDKHTLKIVFDSDGVYRIVMNPKDRAGNKGEYISGSADHTAVYEIDKTLPELFSRNDKFATDDGFVKTPFCDVYYEKRKDEAPPTVEFEDVNFARIEVKAVIYTPTYKNGKEMGNIEMNPLSGELSRSVDTNKFTLSDFDKDGVYSLTYVAVDKAGNRSVPINDTYFRMVDTDVLAYIYNSRIGDKNSTVEGQRPSGYYSLMSPSGKAISKKATDFDDLDILVIKPKADKQAGKLVLREDERHYLPSEYSAFKMETEDISETATMVKMHLPGNYFSEAFRDDGLNTRMYLSVSIRDDVYLDLASIRIDNEAPSALLPEGFENWHNYFFESEHRITLTGISEVLDEELSKVYECPRNGKRVEIPHKYDPENGTLSFKLDKGVHHIDITLVDEAGNEWNIDRVKYIRVGNFRLYLIGGGILLLVFAGVFLMLRKKRR